MKKIEIFDSTLRDGAQSEGISFSVEDKLSIVKYLDKLGISYIEAGNPGSNPKDCEFFKRVQEIELKNSKIVAFGATRRKNTLPQDDPNLSALLSTNCKIICIFGKCWDMHVREILNVSPEENLAMVEDSCMYLSRAGREIFFDAEHFFDGYKANPEFAINVLKAALVGGSTHLILCDTNGGCFPNEIFDITQKVKKMFPETPLGIHLHNDGGMAVANSIMAVNAGVTQVQGTYLGFGERCGNAELSTVIANLQLKLGFYCIPKQNLQLLTPIANKIADISNLYVWDKTPYIGKSAFAHKAGMHADGVLKNSRSFEHISPSLVGNDRKVLMSEISGKSAIYSKIQQFLPNIQKDSLEVKSILSALKEYEHQGYQFENAEGSFAILCYSKAGIYKSYFELINYQIFTTENNDSRKNTTATVKIRVGEKLQLTAAEGNGPVNALDTALRRALEVFYPELKQVHLIDYKVRVMDSGQATASAVRVLISSTDGTDIWTTVGVSNDVVEASWIALADSIEYKLFKDEQKNKN